MNYISIKNLLLNKNEWKDDGDISPQELEKSRGEATGWGEPLERSFQQGPVIYEKDLKV